MAVIERQRRVQLAEKVQLAETGLTETTADAVGWWTDQDGIMNREISPTSIAAPAANYAHAVLTDAPSCWLHTSGVVPVAPDGTTPIDVGAQAVVVWSNIAAMLVDSEMTPVDIVSVTTYVVAGEPLGPVMSARDDFLAGHHAASTLVTVPELAQPQWRMEVAIIAAR